MGMRPLGRLHSSREPCLIFVSLVSLVSFVAGVLFEQKRLTLSCPKLAKTAERKELTG